MTRSNSYERIEVNFASLINIKFIVSQKSTDHELDVEVWVDHSAVLDQ